MAFRSLPFGEGVALLHDGERSDSRGVVAVCKGRPPGGVDPHTTPLRCEVSADSVNSLGRVQSMNPLLKRLYDAAPVGVQNLMVTAFSVRLDRQRYGGRFREFQELMEEAQWWDAGRMAEWQDSRLREVVAHAYAHVPDYRELFDHRGSSRRTSRPDRISSSCPCLIRDTVKRRLPELLSRATPKSRLAEGHTSGTTGSPLTVLYDANMMHMNYAALDRQYRWAGVRMARWGDRVAVIRGNIIVPLDQRRPPFWRMNYLHRQLLLSNFHLSPDNLRSLLRGPAGVRPGGP